MGFDIRSQSLLKTILLFLFMYTIFGIREYVFYTPFNFNENYFSATGKFILDFSVSKPKLNGIFTFIILFINSLFITRIAIRNLIILEKSYLPAVLFLIVSAGYVLPKTAIIPLISSFFAINSIENIINSYRRLYTFKYFFNAAISLGMAFIVFPQCVPLVLLLPVALIYMARIWRDWVLCISGFFIPIFFGCYINWSLGVDFTEFAENLCEIITNSYNPYIWKDIGVLGYSLAGFYFILMVMGIIAFMTHKGHTKKRTIMLFVIFIWFTLFITGIFILSPDPAFIVSFVAIPLSVILSALFNKNKSLLSSALYAVLLVITFIYNLLPILSLLVWNS